PDANGSATFVGAVSGPIAKPLLNGEFTLDNHVYRQWKIQHAAGGIGLDLSAENAVLKNVRVQQGASEILLNGSSGLSGSPIDVRIECNRVTADDIRPFVNRDIGGVFAGVIRVTSISPKLNLEGNVRADNLSIANHLIGTAQGRIRFIDPLVDISELSIRQV